MGRTADERKRHESVDAQSGSQTEWHLADEAHRQGHDTRSESSHRLHLAEAERVPSAILDARQNARVDDQDVAHGQERDQPGDDFDADSRARLCDAEEPVESRTLTRRNSTTRRPWRPISDNG